MEEKGTEDDEPRNSSNSSGVTIIPRKLPKAELKMAAASFPPTALVSMTADETGGGIQPTVCNPRSSQVLIEVRASILIQSHIATGKKTRVKDWTNRCSFTWRRALVNSSVFNDRPLLKKMADTAT